MVGSVNRAILVGNLGADPEIRALPSGQKVGILSVATNEQWTDRQTGEKRERTEWHQVSVFDPYAVKYMEDYLRKGDKVYIEGKLQTRKWQDQSGSDRYTTEIVVNAVGGSLVGLSSSSGHQRDNGATQNYDQYRNRSGDAVPDDVPF